MRPFPVIHPRFPRAESLAAALWAVLASASAVLAQPAQPVAQLHIDATDLPRHLLTSTLTIPLTGSIAADLAGHSNRLALWYPKWVPGSHAPGGPVQNLAGLSITNQAGTPIEWVRTPGEICRFDIHLPPGSNELRISMRYITDQPSENSRGLDSFGSEDLGIISPNTVLLCPEAADMTTWSVATTLTLPEGWDAASALARQALDPAAPGQPVGTGPATITYAPTTLELLIDSPIMAGRHHKTYALNDPAATQDSGAQAIPPHRLHVFSEVESAVRIHDDILAHYRAMVTQSSLLFGTHPFDSMDILLATSGVLGRNGLEHLRTTLNVIPLDTLERSDSLRGWDRMLVPHEFVHSWCGKYRRPAGMVTGDLYTPQDTELLWVYEGLTQYLGNVLEIRSGMGTPEEYQWDLMNRIRWDRLQQGRDWRTLADTGAAAHSLRAGSPTWGHLRRSQDYYDEGSLIWMEADAIIRRLTDSQRSLDDFCQVFFRHDAGDPVPKGYDRAEIVRVLNQTAAFDWDTFLRERIETSGQRPVLSLAGELGYTIQFTNQPPTGPRDQRADPLDARDSLGIAVGGDGTISTVLLDSPADAAGLAPRMRIIGVGDHLWSRQRFIEALEASPATGSVTLLMASGDRIITRTIAYEGGPRYMTLVRDTSKPDVLSDILKPR